jgi:hypothetical protein
MLSAPHIVGKGRTFDDKDPTGKLSDPHSEVLFKSHAKKNEKMKDWNDSPFKRMKVEEKQVGCIYTEGSCNKSKLL